MVDIIDLLLRWAHIVSISIVVGGSYFVCCVMLRGATSNDVAANRKSISMLFRVAGAVALATGLINSVRQIQAHDFGELPYHGFVAVKLLLAMVVIGLIDRLTGDGPSAEKLRKQEKPLWSLVVVLVTLLVCFAGYMRTVERQPKSALEESALEKTTLQGSGAANRIVTNQEKVDG